MSNEATERDVEALADCLAALPEARTVVDSADEAKIMLTMDVESLARTVLAHQADTP